MGPLCQPEVVKSLGLSFFAKQATWSAATFYKGRNGRSPATGPTSPCIGALKRLLGRWVGTFRRVRVVRALTFRPWRSVAMLAMLATRASARDFLKQFG